MIVNSVFISSGGNEMHVYGSEGQKLVISSADAKRIGLYELAEDPDRLPVEADTEALELMHSKLACIKYAEYLLQFGDKSKKALSDKLATKQYSPEAIESAMTVLEENGLVDDLKLCTRRLSAMAESKLYGPYRLMQEMQKRGFSSKTVYTALDSLDDDVSSRLDKLVSKLTSHTFPQTPKEVLSLKNKLVRYGYSYSDINDAVSRLAEYDD